MSENRREYGKYYIDELPDFWNLDNKKYIGSLELFEKAKDCLSITISTIPFGPYESRAECEACIKYYMENVK